MRWLILLMSLPPTPTRHRVGVWRKLKRMGAVNLRGSAWILPENPERTELFHWLVQEVQSFGGEATLLRVDGIETMSDEEVTALSNGERAAGYQTLKRECREILARLDRLGPSRRGSLDPLRGKLEGAQARARPHPVDRLLPRAHGRRGPCALGDDGQAAPESGGAAEPGCRDRPAADRAPAAGEHVGHAPAAAHRPDPSGSPHRADAAKKGIPFDVVGAEFGHHGEDCTFETLVSASA